MSTEYTSKADLLNTIEGMEHYKAGNPDTKSLYLASTSGSTGNPLLFLRREPPQLAEHESYREYGDYLHIAARRQNALLIASQLLEHGNAAMSVLFLDKSDADMVDLSWLCKEMQPQILSGPPQSYLTLKNSMGLKDAAPCTSIKKIVIGSGLLEPDNAKRIGELFPHAGIEIRYNMTESTTAIGVSCPHAIDTYYWESGGITPVHPIKNVSILKPDEDGWGEVVVSSHQLQNYKTGDLGKIIDESCACGKQSVLLVKGRAHQDRVHCIGATFLLSEIEKIMADFSYINDYRFEISEEKIDNQLRGKVVLHIASKEPLGGSDFSSKIESAVSNKLYVTKSRTLGQLIAEDMFLPLEIKIVEEFPPTNKPIRLKKIVY